MAFLDLSSGPSLVFIDCVIPYMLCRFLGCRRQAFDRLLPHWELSLLVSIIASISFFLFLFSWYIGTGVFMFSSWLTVMFTCFHVQSHRFGVWVVLRVVLRAVGVGRT